MWTDLRGSVDGVNTYPQRVHKIQRDNQRPRDKKFNFSHFGEFFVVAFRDAKIYEKIQLNGNSVKITPLFAENQLLAIHIIIYIVAKVINELTAV